MNKLDQVTISTDTWMKDPPHDQPPFSIDAEFWRRTPEGKHEFRTFYGISPKSFTRLVRLLVSLKNAWVANADQHNAYYGEKYDTASLTMSFDRKEN